MPDPADTFFVDHNGCLAERMNFGGDDVIVHYDDIPESDVTEIRGIPCTTPLRTVIDLANDVTAAELRNMIEDCLSRGLFTIDEVLERTTRPDIRDRAGAKLVRAAVRR